MARSLLGVRRSDVEDLRGLFRLFGERWFIDSSPLYERFSLDVAEDPELAGLLMAAPPDQRWPVLFFAAVHFLVMRNPDEPLAEFFTDLASPAKPAADGLPALREMCRRRRGELTDLIAANHTQTNEVGRCAYTLLGLELISREVKRQRLALVEIGCSAGLNLLLDEYGYDYGPHGTVGPADAPVIIHTELRGEVLPPLGATCPPIGFRTGIEVHPIDVREPDDALWLRACVWPEHTARLELLTQALEFGAQHPPPVIAGDGPSMLPEVAAGIPPDQHLVVIHTNVLPYFSPDARETWLDVVAEVASKRDLTLLFCESTLIERAMMPSVERLQGLPPDGFPLARIDFAGGARQEQVLALTGNHGTWLEWLAS